MANMQALEQPLAGGISDRGHAAPASLQHPSSFSSPWKVPKAAGSLPEAPELVPPSMCNDGSPGDHSCPAPAAGTRLAAAFACHARPRGSAGSPHVRVPDLAAARRWLEMSPRTAPARPCRRRRPVPGASSGRGCGPGEPLPHGPAWARAPVPFPAPPAPARPPRPVRPPPA